MLMVNYLQRFLFRWKFALLIILIIAAIAAAVSFQINRWLPEYALSLSKVIAQQFQTQISFNSVHYRFPNYIILKNVKAFDLNRNISLLETSKIIMNFSFPLFSSATPLNYIMLDSLVIDLPDLKNYLTLHHQKIFAWAKTLPQGDMHLIVPNGKYYPQGYTKGNPVSFNIDLRLNQGQLNANGYWGDKDKFTYEIYGKLQDYGFDLDKLILGDNESSINLWGSWRNNSIYWKGFIFYNKFYILDIDGNLNIQDKDIALRKLSFSIDGDNVEAWGHCLKVNPFQCDADIDYRRQAQHVTTQEPLKNIHLHLNSQKILRSIVFQGASDINFLVSPDSSTSLQSIHFDFKDLKARLINNNFLRLKIKNSSLSLNLKNKILPPVINIPIDDLWASFNFTKPFQKSLTLSAKMMDGNFYSRVFLDTTTLPWQVTSQGRLNGLNIYQGLLSATYRLQSSKNIELSGSLNLHNGEFNNTIFQNWMAAALQMPSLTRVSNANLSCRFNINNESKILDELKLNSDDLNLNGFFHLDADDLVSSQASVQFSKKLLSESPVGRDIIGLVHGAWTLPFNFSLSGNVRRMNFQWDKSPLKDKVRQHMFSFIERMIDRRMDYKVTMPSESVSPG